MKIALIETFFAGSHKRWAEEFKQHSSHDIQIFSLPGKYWKWRMHGGAISLAKALLDSNFWPDLILATDMVNVPVFISLIKEKINCPLAMYFHENQLSYPWSQTDRDTEEERDFHYHFINYTSALSSKHVFFNSAFHKQSFFKELKDFIRMFPDYQNQWTFDQIGKKSSVLPLGLDLKVFDKYYAEEKHETPIILWNHRWEYDKNPELFFTTLINISKRGHDFKLVVLGENYKRAPKIFTEAKKELKDQILHFGYNNSFDEYAEWLWKADIYPVTSNQDFFGGSVVEALYTLNKPLLPNRLAYPEHLPKSEQIFLYDDDNEFERKLIELIEGKSNPNVKEIQTHVKKYNWETMIEKYDREMELVLKA